MNPGRFSLSLLQPQCATEIAADVRRHLQVLGGHSRWSVQVSNGEVVVTDKFHEASDRAVVQVLAESVPGVIRAIITAAPEPADRR